MQPLYGLDMRRGGDLTDTTRAALEFFRDLLPSLPPCSVSLYSHSAPLALVWSDGAFEDKGELQDIGFIVLTPRRGAPPLEALGLVVRSYVKRFYLGPKLLRLRFVKAKQKVNQVELVGALCPYLSLRELLRGRNVIHWVDNTAALSALLKGYSLSSLSACVPFVECRRTCLCLVRVGEISGQSSGGTFTGFRARR